MIPHRRGKTANKTKKIRANNAKPPRKYGILCAVMKRPVLFFHTSRRQAWQKELAGAYRFARVRGWRVQVVEPTPRRPPSVASLLALWNPLGCLVECSGAASDYFDPAAFGGLPAVFLGRDPRTLPRDASFVNPSTEGPGRCAAMEFLSAGLASFGFVASGSDSFWSRDREAEFRKTLRLNGYPCGTFGRGAAFKTPRARGKALRDWLLALPKPCGVFAENDYAASEVLDYAARLRLDVPKALAVIGADNDSSLCENTTPQLSSVLLDFEQAGYRASEILASHVDDPSAPPVHETYSALGLVRRASTPAGLGTPPRIARAISFIREKACSGISVRDVVREMAGSPRLAEMDFKNATGHTIMEEILRVRFERVELLLRSKSQRLDALAGLCGWRTGNALRTAFLKRYGMSMRAWRAASARMNVTRPGSATPRSAQSLFF